MFETVGRIPGSGSLLWTAPPMSRDRVVPPPVLPVGRMNFASGGQLKTGRKGPAIAVEPVPDGTRARISGSWTIDHASEVEGAAEKLLASVLASLAAPSRVVFDMSGIDQLDTLGAWVLFRTGRDAEAGGHAVELSAAKPDHRLLIEEVSRHDVDRRPLPKRSALYELLADIGQTVIFAGRDLVSGLVFLGESVSVFLRTSMHPGRFRLASLVRQIELIAYRSVPIIALISFLVGGIVAQQGIFQLGKFGATLFAVDLVGILTLRELGVLLTAIMIAGRSGSAFTAEIGSMKMREEIDAIRVMGMNPMEVLILPRLLALVISLPMLTFLADLSALLGGGLVAWIYGGISPDIYVDRLREAIWVSTFLVGLIKAPFMALIIGLIAAIEGFAVQGSAESLGRHVTSSVVKAIFMVIVSDGLFAMFFAAIEY